MNHNIRDYGLGDSNPYVVDVPRCKGEARHLPPCPNCGCVTLYQIEVTVRNPLLKGGTGIGQYIGCPACPFASPMLMTAINPN